MTNLTLNEQRIRQEHGDHEAGAAVSTSQLPGRFSMEPVPAAEAPKPGVQRIYRHALPVRVGHWLNVVCLSILVMSGLQIFNAHQALYWGDRSDRNQSLLSIRAARGEDGQRSGVTTILGHEFETTGVLGVSGNEVRAFPAWATLPGSKWLAMGRRWHLFFAWIFVVNGLLFWLYAIVSRHAWRDLVPKWRDLRGIGRDIWNHVTFRHPMGEEARHYTVLQKLAYSSVMFGLGPLIVLTGLSMSPTIDAGFPFLPELFGGRQSARTLHFLACVMFVGFIVIHVGMVIITGLRNNLRAMVTGWFQISHSGGSHETGSAH